MELEKYSRKISNLRTDKNRKRWPQAFSKNAPRPKPFEKMRVFRSPIIRRRTNHSCFCLSWIALLRKKSQITSLCLLPNLSIPYLLVQHYASGLKRKHGISSLTFCVLARYRKPSAAKPIPMSVFWPHMIRLEKIV